MIAVVRIKPLPCVVRWTGRQGLSAISKTYCGAEANAGQGVEQVPDKTPCCADCTRVITQIEAKLG